MPFSNSELWCSKHCQIRKFVYGEIKKKAFMSQKNAKVSFQWGRRVRASLENLPSKV
jgi:hypothetical protein